MNNRANGNDFDELEPRVTPQPTLLKCLTTPSVPEVSMIFGKRPEAAQQQKKARSPRDQEYETYASWKKEEFPSPKEARIDSRNSFQLLEASSSNNINNINNNSNNNKSQVRLKPSSNESSNLIPNSEGKFRESSLRNEHQIQSNHQSKNLAVVNQSSEATRSVIADNVRFHEHDHRFQDESSAFPFPRSGRNFDLVVEKRSYEGVRSILKNSPVERGESTNRAASPERSSQRKLASNIGQSPRNLVPDYCRLSSNNRSHRQIEANQDQGTVQDLLLLVQNQNEQIKTLQNQVERLLQAHEESLGCRDGRACLARQSNELPQTAIYGQEEKYSAGNGISPQKVSHSRVAKIASPRKFDEQQPEVSLRYQSDQVRNAIMEKKVSIGVMTSFEFSVHNNPFVSDSDHQINAVLRECGKNLDSPENWRKNIAPGPLENINEDSEGISPSSPWRMSNNNKTQASSTKNASSRRIAVVNEYRACGQNPLQSSGNEWGNFFNKSNQPPVPAPRKLPSSARKQRGFPAVSEQRTRHSEHSETFPSSNIERERESCDFQALNERNNCSRDAKETSGERYSRDCQRFQGSEALSQSPKPMKNMPENIDEPSLVLSSSDLRVIDRPPTPDPSIHVEMREYSSDDESEKPKRAPPVGWTFYKNIVGQVNRILHTIPDTKDAQENGTDDPHELQNEIYGHEEAVDSVKLATLERLKMLGISYAEHSEFAGEHVQKKVTFDSSYSPRLDYQATLPQPTGTVTESNTSMHMKALALKYLSDEQLADLAVQKQGDASGMKHKMLNNVHATNMSLATMNYLQRYCLVSGVNSPHSEGKGHVNTLRQKKLKHVVLTKELHAQPQLVSRQPAFNDSASKKEPDNILDITTLKQQPKLL